jgi:hypothetical protein
MCECNLLVEKYTSTPIEISNDIHSLKYIGSGKEYELLSGIKISGIINYSACYEVRDMHGVSKGYMIIFGEK